MWASLGLSSLELSALPELLLYFLHLVREVCRHYFFQTGFQFLILSLLLPAPHDTNVGKLEVVPKSPFVIRIFKNSFFFVLF